MKARWWFGLGLLGLSLALPAVSQGVPFRFTPPASLVAAGDFLVSWNDVADDDPIVTPTCITWYYASSPDGADRKRLTTEAREDFSTGFRQRWTPVGPFQFDWTIARDRFGREQVSYLKGGRQCGPILYNREIPSRGVISCRVRPTGIKNEFGIGFRTQPNESGFELRNRDLELVLLDQNRVVHTAPLGEAALMNRWYWYEISCRTQARTEVQVRVRVFDEQHQNLLVSFDRTFRPSDRALLRDGGMAFWGPLEVAEVYIDTWDARWVDGRRNLLKWDTADVPNGKYFLLAETHDQSRRQVFASPYLVEVRNSRTVAAQ